MLQVGKVGKVIVQIAVGAAVGTMAHDFAKKHVGEPLQKFMDSMTKEKYKMEKEKIEKGL